MSTEILKQMRLEFYIKKGDVEGIKELVNVFEANLNFTNRYGTMLMLAAMESQWNVVQLLIELGADVHNTHGANEWKILHYAAKLNWLPVIEIFIDKKLDLELKASDLRTPLMIAAFFNRRDVVELLVNGGANIDARDNQGNTALHYAAYHGRMEIVKYLVEKKANVNIQCLEGLTPFHVILRKTFDIELICCFIRAGADCNLGEMIEGVTPFNLICRKKLLQAIFLSIEKGAYMASCDYRRCLMVPSLKNNVLTQVKYCSQSIINKYNKKDLPNLYKVRAASDMLPAIEVMKIKDTSEIAAEIDRVVEQDIEKNGYCNLQMLQPLSLSMMSVKAFLEHVKKERSASYPNSFQVQSGLKRLSLEECPPAKRRSFGF